VSSSGLWIHAAVGSWGGVGRWRAALIVSLDVTIVNVALPTLVRQLGATTSDLRWVVDTDNLVVAALVLVAGSPSDRRSRKGMPPAGLGVDAPPAWPGRAPPPPTS
jgi:MFS family permease